MVSQKVFQNGFRPVSDPFGGAHGALPFSGKEAELKHGHCPSKCSGNETKTLQKEQIFPATEKQNKAMMLQPKEHRV